MPDKKSHGRSKTGVEFADEVLDQMAKEAEDGLEISELRRRPGRRFRRATETPNFMILEARP